MKQLVHRIFIIFLTLAPCLAFSQTSYRVTDKRVNVRNKPSSDALVVGILNQDDIISVTELKDGWAAFSFKGKLRYINAAYIEQVGKSEEAVEQEVEKPSNIADETLSSVIPLISKDKTNISETDNSPSTASDETSPKAKNSGLITGADAFLMYQPDAKDFGLGFTFPIASIPFLSAITEVNCNFKFGNNNITTYGFYFGLGLTPRYLIGNLLLQGKLYPYLGYGGIDVPKEVGRYTMKDSMNEFAYGASAEATIGLKIAGPDDKGLYLNFGYKVFAAKFKTDNMFKSGYLMVSLVRRW